MKGETILCIATRVWNSLWRDSQQYMSRFAAHNRVLYFEPGRNPDRPVFAEMWRNSRHLVFKRARELNENLIIIPTPPSLPYGRRHLPRSVLQLTVPLVATINARTLIHHVRWWARECNVDSPILWLYNPRQIDLVGKFGEKLVCYFNYDEFPNFVANKHIKQLLREYDNRLSRRADVVFATSRSQWERRKELNPQTYFTPNAVDFDLFHRALDPVTPIPADAVDLKKPVIGYAGWLGHQIDVNLLQRIAETYPDCSLVLVGPDELPSDKTCRLLHSLDNVHFLGRKKLSSMPNYLKAFDVALIPYALAGYTLTAYPLKLHEYLAAGRAIVATALPELRPYSHLIRIAESHDEFIQGIDEAFHDYAPQVVEARVELARENTWNHRVATVYRALQPLLSS